MREEARKEIKKGKEGGESFSMLDSPITARPSTDGGYKRVDQVRAPPRSRSFVDIVYSRRRQTRSSLPFSHHSHPSWKSYLSRGRSSYYPCRCFAQAQKAKSQGCNTSPGHYQPTKPNKASGVDFSVKLWAKCCWRFEWRFIFRWGIQLHST